MGEEAEVVQCPLKLYVHAIRFNDIKKKCIHFLLQPINATILLEVRVINMYISTCTCRLHASVHSVLLSEHGTIDVHLAQSSKSNLTNDKRSHNMHI